MSEEATTPEVETGGTEQAPVESEGTANVDEGGSEVQAKDPESEVEIPEEVKSEFDKIGDPRKKELLNKEFKRAYTKWTQKQAAERKAKEQEYDSAIKAKELEYAERLKDYDQIKSQYAELAKITREALESPDKYEQYRREAGLIKDQLPEGPPKLETAEDLINYVQRLEGEIKALKEGIPTEASKISQQQIYKLQQDQRYVQANEKLKLESPIFKKYEGEILDFMRRSGLMSKYNGANEYDIMKEATEKYYQKVSEDIESAKQELLESMKKKKQSSTLPPTKPISSKQAYPLDRREQIIAKVRDRLG